MSAVLSSSAVITFAMASKTCACLVIVACMENRRVASTSTPSTRRLLDGVAMPVPHRSTEPARPRHRVHPTHWLISTQVLRPCRKPGARARGFKWFDGQGGASVASENAALGNLSAWRAAHAAKLIVLERQGLAKLVSDRLKHLSSQRGVDAVPTHCRDASCAARVSAQRVTLDAGALETQLDAGVRRFSALLNWARAAAAFDDILYIAYGDLVADPERELRRAYRFLGVDEAWQANASVLTKSVSRPLAEVVANYGEVRAALLRTKWAGEVG